MTAAKKAAKPNAPEPWTLDRAHRALDILGCVHDGKPLVCPLCAAEGLTLATSVAGKPFTRCEAGCTSADIQAKLEVAIGLRDPQGESVSAIGQCRDDLDMPELVRIVKHGKAGTAYELHLKDGTIVSLGNAADLGNQAKFRAAFLPQAGRYPPRCKTAEWDRVVEHIERASEAVEIDSLADETIGWLAGSTQGVRTLDARDSAVMFDVLSQRDPPAFIDTATGRLHVRLPPLQTWLGRQAGVKISQPDLSSRLAHVGCERVTLAARSGSTVRSQRYWRCPPTLGL